MSELNLIVFAAAIAAIMALLLKGGTSASLRAAIRTSLVLLLGWSLAYQAHRPVSWDQLSLRIQLMLVLSLMAFLSAWGLHLFESKNGTRNISATADKVNVIIAAAFSILLVLGDAPARYFFAILLLSGSYILAARRA